MQELEATGRRIAAVWWLIVWRGMAGGVLLGAVAGFIVGFFAAVVDRPDVIPTLSAVLGSLAGFIWSWFVVRMVLSKTYKGFRLAVVAVAA